jgi:hypothetical protein
MKPLLKSMGVFLFLLLTFSPPAAAGYYDQNGVAVDKAQYENIVETRQANITKINTDGYGQEKATLEDPVLLRKKRIEQWKALQKPKQPVSRAVKNPRGSGKK